MGINDRADENKRNKRTRSKEARGRRAQSAGQIEMGTLDWACIIALTEELVRVGGAVRLGATRDGGAWAFGIYQGDDYATEYIRPAEDFEAAVSEIVAAWIDDAASARWWERVLAIRAAAAR